MTGRNRRHEISSRLGQKIAQFRASHRWSHNEFARVVGLSPTYLRLLEYGENVPTLVVIVQLAPVFGMKPWELVRELTEPVQ
jgi:transcriptional regulator with XRE-family HTH domain